MANIHHLIQTFQNGEKTYVLTFRCVGGDGMDSRERERQLRNINWIKVADLTSVFTKVIRDENFTNEVESLKRVLILFRGNQLGSRVEYSINVAINHNEVGNPIDGLTYLFE